MADDDAALEINFAEFKKLYNTLIKIQLDESGMAVKCTCLDFIKKKRCFHCLGYNAFNVNPDTGLTFLTLDPRLNVDETPLRAAPSVGRPRNNRVISRREGRVFRDE